MATSDRFSVAPWPGDNTGGGTSKARSILSVIVAVSAVVAIFLLAGSVWLCWFRKRRREIRAQSRSSTPKSKKSFVPLDPRKQISRSPIRESKPDIEERSAEEGFGRGGSKHEQTNVAHGSPQPLPVPAPPVPAPPAAPIEGAAELPIFVTPRSSRHVSIRSRRLRAAAELGTYPPSPRPKSSDGTEGVESKTRSITAARLSKRPSLQQILQLAKVVELESDTKPGSGDSDHPAQTETLREVPRPGTQTSRSGRRSKRFSLQHFLRFRRVAELEGSSASAVQSPSAPSGIGGEPPKVATNRSYRRSLHRLLQSKRLAELEANTDVLPVYSHTDADRKLNASLPPLPPEDMDFKALLSLSLSPKRSMTPVELDAAEPARITLPSPERNYSRKSLNQSIAGLAGSSSSSPIPPERTKASDKEPGSALDRGPVTLLRSSMNQSPRNSMPCTPDAVEFLDLTSTESERDDDDGLGLGRKDTTTTLSNFATPFASPSLEDSRMDPFLTAEIISAALESLGSSPAPPGTEYAEEIKAKEDAAKEEPPTIHEMDATESAIKRRSKRQSPRTIRDETHRKRPDFVTFKKQMSEAERRAKMIARRRKSRRRLTPKSF